MEEAIKIFNDYLEQVPKGGSMLFRGHENQEWFLDTGATRRLRKSKIAYEDKEYKIIVPQDFNRFVEYHKDLITRAQENKYHQRTVPEQNDLELLANLQHFGAATCLMDFTKNFIVALWFACQGEKMDGKVFCLDTSSVDIFQKITPKDIRKSIAKLLRFESRIEAIVNEPEDIETPDNPLWLSNKDKLWLWEPPIINNRILQQDSVFVFGKPVLLPKEYSGILNIITIKLEHKPPLLELLEKRFNKNAETLFKDFYGFAYVNSYEKPITTLKRASEYLEAGNKKFQAGKYEEAIKDYDVAIKLKGDYANAYYNRGKAKRKLQRYEESIKDCTQAMSLKKDFDEAFFDRAISKYYLGKYEEAIEDYDQVIRLKPDFADAYSNRGQAKADLGNYDEAMKDYDQAIRLKPDYANAYNNRGAANNSQGKYEDAIQDYDSAIKIRPDFAMAYYNMGNAKTGLERYEDAIVDFNKAIELNPNYFSAYNNRGHSKVNLGKNEEAIKDYEQTIKLNPSHSNAFYNMGIVYDKLSDLAKAITNFEIAKEFYSKQRNKRMEEKTNKRIEEIKAKMEAKH